MDILIPFLNYDEISHHISRSMSNILTYQNQLTKQEKEIDELIRLLDVLPSNFHFDSLPIACQLFDYLLENSPSIQHYRLSSSCLNLMKIEDCPERIKTILSTILSIMNKQFNYMKFFANYSVLSRLLLFH